MAKDIRLSHDSEISEVVGTHRLCQKFIIELLTTHGSMRFLPFRGCNFLPRIQQHAQTELDIMVAFASAKRHVQRNMKFEEADLPMTERYADAIISRIEISDGSVVLDIIVRSKAGTQAKVKTPPIPFLGT